MLAPLDYNLPDAWRRNKPNTNEEKKNNCHYIQPSSLESHDLYLITIQAISLFGAIYPRNQHQHSAVFHVFLLIFLGWVEHGASRPSELLYLRCCSHLCHLCASGDQNCDCINKKFTTLMILTKQVTHFVAWFSLDQRRQLAHRDGCICCYTHKNFEVQYLRKVDNLDAATNRNILLSSKSYFFSHTSLAKCLCSTLSSSSSEISSSSDGSRSHSKRMSVLNYILAMSQGVVISNTNSHYTNTTIEMAMFEVVILLVTAAMMVFGLWGTLSLTQVHISPEKENFQC